MDRQAAIDQILDHYENPRHYGTLEQPSFTEEGVNPGCGDVVRISARLDGEQRIAEIAFEGEGCTISQAAASMLMEMALGRTLDEVLLMDADELAARMGREVVATRLPCVSLGLRVLQTGVRKARRIDPSLETGAGAGKIGKKPQQR